MTAPLSQSFLSLLTVLLPPAGFEVKGGDEEEGEAKDTHLRQSKKLIWAFP